MSLRESFPTFFRATSAMARLFGRVWAAIRWSWPRVRRILRPVLFVLASLATLVALLWAGETYRTGRAWEKYRAELVGRGVKLTMAELAPPLVPDDQNFAMTPLLKSVYAPYKKGESLGDRLMWWNPEEPDMPGLGGWQTGHEINSAKWEEYFHGPILEHLKKFDAEMAEISTAIRRPYSRFPLDYAKQPASSIFVMEIGPLLTLEKLFTLRGAAELAAGQNDAALEDAITALRLSQANANEPVLISGLTSAAMLFIGTQAVWQGLAGHCWTEAQLARLQQEIQRIDFLAQSYRDLEGERAFFTSLLTWQEEQGFLKRMKLTKQIVSSDQSNRYFAALVASTQLALNRALLTGNQWYENTLLPRINLTERRFDPTQLPTHPWQWSDSLADYAPEGFLIGSIFPAMNSCLATFARAQATLDQAAVACALERYRLAHGAYPEKLEELLPQFMVALPRDDVTGGPLHYQRRENDTFLLYSLGWMGEDHHGLPLQPGSLNDRNDNWAWPSLARRD